MVRGFLIHARYLKFVEAIVDFCQEGSGHRVLSETVKNHLRVVFNIKSLLRSFILFKTNLI